MVRAEERVLYEALGFLAVVISGDDSQKDGAVRATALATMMEAFCHRGAKSIAHQPEKPASAANDDDLDDVIEKLKGSAHIRQLICITEDKSLLVQLYHRLQERQREQADATFIKEEIARLLEIEMTAYSFQKGMA